MPTRASSSRARLSIGRKSAFGAAFSGPLLEQRFTSETLKPNQQNQESDEIRTDGQVTDHIRVNMSAGGGIPFELSFGAQDIYMAAVLRATSNIAEVSVTGTVHSWNASTKTLSRASGSYVSDGFKLGARIYVSGFTGGGVSGWAYINDLQATAMVLGGIDSIGITDAAGEAVTIYQEPGWNAAAKLTATDISQAASDNSINTAGGDFVAAGFKPYQWIKISGFAGAGYNGLAKIVSVTTGKIIVSEATMVDNVAGVSVTVTQGAYIENGVTPNVLLAEREYTDLSNDFATFDNCEVSKLSLKVEAGNKITGSTDLMGTREVSATATAGSRLLLAPAGSILNAIDNVSGAREGGNALGFIGLNLDISNKIADEPEAGTLGATGHTQGDIAVEGSFTAYYASKTLYDKFLNNTKTNFNARLIDASGSQYVIDIPRAKFTDGSRAAGGKNTPIKPDMKLGAFMHEGEKKTIRIARFPA